MAQRTLNAGGLLQGNAMVGETRGRKEKTQEPARCAALVVQHGSFQ
jgi:hypothetical protein